MPDDNRSAARRELGQRVGPYLVLGPSVASAPASTRARVLIVDDVEDNRDLYATCFEHAGFRTEQACDGEQALEMIADRTPDVVIMDLMMPKVDGWEATRRVKSDPKTANVIVIVVTGSAAPSTIERARAAGADEVRTKPCLPKELLGLVRDQLARRAQRAARSVHEGRAKNDQTR